MSKQETKQQACIEGIIDVDEDTLFISTETQTSGQIFDSNDIEINLINSDDEAMLTQEDIFGDKRSNYKQKIASELAIPLVVDYEITTNTIITIKIPSL